MSLGSKVYRYPYNLFRRLDSKYLVWRIRQRLSAVQSKLPYQFFEFSQVKKFKASDVLFIFGSGPSINDLSADEIEKFSHYDTISFNRFCLRPVVECKFHLTHDIYQEWRPFSLAFHRERCRHYADSFQKYKRAPIHLLQGEPYGLAARVLLTENLLPPGSSVIVYPETPGSRDLNYVPSLDAPSLAHCGGTLTDCVHFGYLMGYKQIVMVGVDLTSCAYFFLPHGVNDPDNERRGIKLNAPHATAERMLYVLPRWKTVMDKTGIEMTVYSEQSMLRKFMPKFEWKTLSA